MRKSLGLVVALLFVAGCGQSMQPFNNNFDSGVGDDLSAGGGGSGGHDMAGAKSDLGFGDGGAFDSAGPSITITTPGVGDFVSGFFAVKVDVIDPSGVDPASVIAEFGNINSTDITLGQTGPTSFEGIFDVHALAKDYVLAEISVRAKDKLGNLSQIGEEVVIDIVKPWMTMDSASQIYAAKHDATGMSLECSRPFSAIGSDAAHEGEVVQQLMTLRARIEDHGNEAPGLAVERFSTVDDGSVQMFVIHDDGNTPLAVDTDGDTYCDDVNPLLIPTAGPVMMQNEALSLRMVPITPAGAPDYRSSAATPPAACASIGDAGTTVPPSNLCGATPMTYAIGYTTANLPEIYTLPPVKAGDSADCVGFQLDAANQLPEGPACVITRAADKAGNVEVSFPLHVCIDLGHHMCDTYSPTAAHCTGIYDKATMMLTPGTCTAPPSGASAALDGPATFPPNEVRFVGP